MKRLKTIASAIALAVIASVGAQAQILYKVEKSGSDKVSYLLGTHHFAPVAVIDSISELPKILEDVDCLYGEIDMEQMKDPSVMMGMQQKLVAPADSTLDKVLTATQLDSLKQVWDKYTGGAAPLEMMYMVKPAVITTQLSALMVQKVLPEINPMEGIDMTMQNRARDLGKKVGGLETFDFQVDMLYDRPVSEQAKELVKIISDVPAEERKALDLSNAYLNHDIDKILSMMTDMEKEDPESCERMIYSRNDNWVTKLSEEMPERSVMVVVGAAHLAGDRGVIAGLRNAGFNVTAVK